jgi:hypothetical protein
VRQTEKEGQNNAACGYGLLGLCCSACLHGPCRLTPFDEDPVKGLCGDDRDLMVARNLLRLALRDTFRAIRDLKETVLETGSLSPISPLVGETMDLLSPFPKGVGSLLSSLYPENVFPAVRQIFRGTDFPPESLISLSLDSVDVGEKESSGVEEILTHVVRTSLLVLISEELRKNLIQQGDRGPLPEEDQRISEELECLPSIPCPVIIHLSDGDLPLAQSLSRSRDEFRQKLDGKAPMVSIKAGCALPEIGRRLSKKWALSVSDMRSTVLISSRHVTSVLGALGLGFTVVSFPALPIHGSVRTEKFFCEDFQTMFGSAYLHSWEEDTMAKILQRG